MMAYPQMNSYPMYIHLKKKENISTYVMSPDYSKGIGVWSYSVKFNESLTFLINDNSKILSDKEFVTISPAISFENQSNVNDVFYDSLLLLSNKNYSEGFLLLNDLIHSNQDTEIAAEAEYVYAEIYLNDFEEYKTAASYYKKIIEEYPKFYNVVKKSMFTLAYVYANHLDYYTDAIDIYERFKKEYPDDDLIVSINYELENLYKHHETIKSLLNSSNN